MDVCVCVCVCVVCACVWCVCVHECVSGCVWVHLSLCVCVPPPPVLLLHEVGHNEEPCAVEAMCTVHPHHTHGVLLKEGLADGDELLHLIGSGCLSIPAWGHGGASDPQPTNVQIYLSTRNINTYYSCFSFQSQSHCILQALV